MPKKQSTNLIKSLRKKAAYQMLAFDSKLFGFKVAKILPGRLNLAKLQAILQELVKQNVTLVYWASDLNDEVSQLAAQKVGGFLADLKVTYKAHLKKSSFKNSEVAPEISEYKNARPNQALEQLALVAGKFSRFQTDPKFPRALFEKLYKKWIINSVNHSIAEHVLVYKINNKIVGLITLGKKTDRGDIGLFAVTENFRGQGIGKKLILAAQKQFIADGYKINQVVTQLGNLKSCRLYEKCGYKKEKIEAVHHFWL